MSNGVFIHVKGILEYREIPEEKSTKEQKGISVSVSCKINGDVIKTGLCGYAGSKERPRLP